MKVSSLEHVRPRLFGVGTKGKRNEGLLSGITEIVIKL